MEKITDLDARVTVPATGEITTLTRLALQRRVSLWRIADRWDGCEKVKIRYFAAIDDTDRPAWQVSRGVHDQIYVISTSTIEDVLLAA